jgi:hypothetical protein
MKILTPFWREKRSVNEQLTTRLVGFVGKSESPKSNAGKFSRRVLPASAV